ncbi:putative Integral membrane protein [Seiridium unicorne]|uniref:Integral membrane protein n=1 Tax=Seiridium unicorne TaxID=138068 RepID=A0ABR2UYF4_9PEZI
MGDIPPGIDLSQIPLAPNPNGDPPNFDGGPSMEPTILATGITFIVISLVRLWVESLIQLPADDVHFKLTWNYGTDFCLFGALAGIAYWFVLYELQVKHGTAKHTWDIPVTAITPTVMKGQSAVLVLTSVANPLVKGSILVFFLRLFGTLRWVRIFCYGLLSATLVLYGAYLIALLVLCIPPRGQPWDSVLLARCATSTPATITIGVCAVVIDTAIFIMPFFIIAGLKLSRDRKRGLAIVFLVGFLIVVTSVVGLAYRIIVSNGSVDPLWDGAKVSITAYIEILGTAIVSCAPALSSFWFKILVKSNIYSSLRSMLSRSRLHGRSSPRSLSPRHHDLAHKHSADIEYCSHCEHCQPSKRLHTPSSTHELVETPSIPLRTIQKSTLITQNCSEGLYDDSAPQDRQVKTGNIIREEW